MSADTDRSMTAARCAYAVEHKRLIELFRFINDAASVSEQHAARKLADTPRAIPVGGQAPPFDRKERPGAGALNELRSHANAIFQIWLARAIDNYMVYMSELLAEILDQRPEVLRSSEKVPVDEVLSYPSKEAFIKALAEKRVNNWNSDGVKKISEKFRENMSFELFNSHEQLSRVVEAVAIRNAIVHNRGVVDREFLRRVPGSVCAVGQQVPLTEMYVFGVMTMLEQSVADIDGRAIAKFGI
jgi:hypothetical protein